MTNNFSLPNVGKKQIKGCLCNQMRGNREHWEILELGNWEIELLGDG